MFRKMILMIETSQLCQCYLVSSSNAQSDPLVVSNNRQQQQPATTVISVRLDVYWPQTESRARPVKGEGRENL